MKNAPKTPFRQRLVLLCLLPALCLLTGCFTFETLIKLNPDGSGTVEQVFSIHGPMLEMLAFFADEDGNLPDLCDDESLQTEAANLGEGVLLTSSERIQEENQMGCHAFYAFDDINMLTIDQDPGAKMPEGADMEADDEGEEDDGQHVTFSFTPGSPATLTILMPQEFEGTPDDDEALADSSQRAMQMQMMREMLQGAKMTLSLQVAGTIAETNATYRDGSTINLMTADFDELLADEGQLTLLMDSNPQSLDEVEALLENISGIEMETQDEVQVRFE
ncbi:MAG TPA: hypothetical protein VKP65_05085 [Rhodothermales bacterium]|nr:hypothetical protein [Rhodothermales bacterium]